MPLPRAAAGQRGEFGDKTLQCQALEFYDFAAADIALFACGSGPAEEYAQSRRRRLCGDRQFLALSHGADVPLIVPEVNRRPRRIHQRNIIANPNCSTAQLVVALKPLHDIAKIRRVVVSTYQSFRCGQCRHGRIVFADPRRVCE